jgi:endonuclease/exonuclease/phosphatase family metal-dependent hydrolase
MLSILTWNLGYCDERFGPWPARRLVVESEIARTAPEVALFQAVERTDGRADAMAEFAAAFPQACCAAFIAAFQDGARERGSGVLSWLPVSALGSKRLRSVTVPSEDRSSRVLVAIQVQASTYRLWLANAHFSWVERRARENVEEALEWMNGMEGPKVLAGDLNTEPSSDVFAPLRRAGWIDAWEALRPDDDGRTFIDGARLSKRIDYAWVSPEAVPLLRAIDRVGIEPASDGLRVSDHFGLSLRLA